jgi:hypothetical protein
MSHLPLTDTTLPYRHKLPLSAKYLETREEPLFGIGCLHNCLVRQTA